MVKKQSKDNFKDEMQEFINQIWKLIPERLKIAIFIIIVILSALKFWPSMGSSNPKTITPQFVMKSQSENFECRFYTEVLANVQEIEKILSNRDERNSNINTYRFIFDNYEKYNGFGKYSLDMQIGNFYVNLKKTPEYSPQQIREVLGQGKNVLEQLENSYGCSNYFKENSEIHAASGDTVVASGSIYNFRDKKK